MASAGNAGFINTFYKLHSLVFSHEKLESFGEVLILLSAVLGVLPRWALNGVIFLLAFGVMRNVLISSAKSNAISWSVC